MPKRHPRYALIICHTIHESSLKQTHVKHTFTHETCSIPCQTISQTCCTFKPCCSLNLVVLLRYVLSSQVQDLLSRRAPCVLPYTNHGDASWETSILTLRGQLNQVFLRKFLSSSTPKPTHLSLVTTSNFIITNLKNISLVHYNIFNRISE
jgi:hypothetical protein